MPHTLIFLSTTFSLLIMSVDSSVHCHHLMQHRYCLLFLRVCPVITHPLPCSMHPLPSSISTFGVPSHGPIGSNVSHSLPFCPSSSPSPTLSSPVTHLPRPSVSVANIHPVQTRSKFSISKPKHIWSLATGSSESKPYSFKETMSHPKWKVVMRDEFDALISNATWNLFHTPMLKIWWRVSWVLGWNTIQMVTGTLQRKVGCIRKSSASRY